VLLYCHSTVDKDVQKLVEKININKKTCKRGLRLANIGIKTKQQDGVFNLYIEMDPFGAFTLLAGPHAVTRWFYSKWTSTIIFLYLVMHEKHRFMQVYVCNTSCILNQK